MLVLSRKSRESVVIGADDGLHRLLKVTVLEIGGGRVRLGFEVEATVPVHRAEVFERIHGRPAPQGPADREPRPRRPARRARPERNRVS
jgi:carbon storage regulator CsrA